ncbi:MAG: hypothetical protein IT291_08475 [Deltaproteobacteria bacterium]|nr:hypothetical protein [Deltaproteobacteria bacterium]
MMNAIGPKINAAMPKQAEIQPSKSGLEINLDSYLDDWRSVGMRLKQAQEKLPVESQKLINLQMHVNSLEFRVQLAAKTGEAMAGSIKQLQSMGNG